MQCIRICTMQACSKSCVCKGLLNAVGMCVLNLKLLRIKIGNQHGIFVWNEIEPLYTFVTQKQLCQYIQ